MAPSTTARKKNGKSQKAGTASEPASPPYTITLRYRGATAIDTVDMKTDDRSFYPFAQHWRYIVANRRRITRATRDSLSREMAAWMKDLIQVGGLWSAQRVVVSIPPSPRISRSPLGRSCGFAWRL